MMQPLCFLIMFSQAGAVVTGLESLTFDEVIQRFGSAASGPVAVEIHQRLSSAVPLDRVAMISALIGHAEASPNREGSHSCAGVLSTLLHEPWPEKAMILDHMRRVLVARTPRHLLTLYVEELPRVDRSQATLDAVLNLLEDPVLMRNDHILEWAVLGALGNFGDAGVGHLLAYTGPGAGQALIEFGRTGRPEAYDHLAQCTTSLERFCGGMGVAAIRLWAETKRPGSADRLKAVAHLRMLACHVVPDIRDLAVNELTHLGEPGPTCPDTAPALIFASPTHLWLGLKNSDDQGTRFDLKTELLVNGTPVASGVTRCITGVTRNPNSAVEATVNWDPFPSTALAAADVVSIRVSTRIGTNADDTA